MKVYEIAGQMPNQVKNKRYRRLFRAARDSFLFWYEEGYPSAVFGPLIIQISVPFFSKRTSSMSWLIRKIPRPLSA